jgi:hypothetical protein
MRAVSKVDTLQWQDEMADTILWLQIRDMALILGLCLGYGPFDGLEGDGGFGGGTEVGWFHHLGDGIDGHQLWGLH